MERTITLPEDCMQFIEAEVAAGGHESASEYIQCLLMKEVLRKNRAKVDGLLLQGLASGEPHPWTDETVENIRQRVLAQQPER